MVDANGNGIPDDQETVVPDTSSATDTEQAPATTYSDPNYVPPTTDNTDTANVQQSAVDPNAGAVASSTTPTTGGTQ